MKYVVGVFIAALFLPVFADGDLRNASDKDRRWKFYSGDRTAYSSAWFDGRHRKLIQYGCTRAPGFQSDRRCKGDRGFHHGIDFATPCGTKIYAAEAGWVVANDSLGAGYGANPVLIRNYAMGRDFVIGHTRKVYVNPGDRVKPGMLIARASDSGSTQGCRLHFETRPARGSVDTAEVPLKYLDLEGRR
jgi:murein DD-endopeptidase MepM/ murein hydrolase activator NlpD